MDISVFSLSVYGGSIHHITDNHRHLNVSGYLSMELKRDIQVKSLVVGVSGKATSSWIRDVFIKEETTLIHSQGRFAHTLRKGKHYFPVSFDIQFDGQVLPTYTCKHGRIEYKLYAHIVDSEKHSKKSTEIYFPVHSRYQLNMSEFMRPIVFDREWHCGKHELIILKGSLSRSSLNLNSDKGLRVNLTIDNLTSETQSFHIILQRVTKIEKFDKVKVSKEIWGAAKCIHHLAPHTRRNIITDFIRIKSNGIVGTIESLRNIFVSYYVVISVLASKHRITIPIKVGVPERKHTLISGRLEHNV